MNRRAPAGLHTPDGGFIRFAEADLPPQVATRQTALTGFQSIGTWLPNPDPVLKKLGKDIATYRDLLSDAHVGGCVTRREAGVQSLEHGLDKETTPDNRQTRAIRSILANLPLVRIIGEMHEAALYGYAVLEILWGRVGGFTVPVDIIGKPQEWFRYNGQNQPVFLSLANPMGEPLDPAKFVIARQKPTYLNPYGRPDLSMCYWPTSFKRMGYGAWVKFVQKYGMPWPVGKYPRGTNDDDIERLMDMLEQMIEDSVAAIPNDSSVEFLKTDNSQNSDAYYQFLMFCRAEVAMALLGQNQSTEASSTLASAKAGREVTKDIRDADARFIAEAISAVIKLIHAQNFGTGTAPKYAFWEQEEIDDTRAKRDETLTKAGIKLTPAYFKRAYGLADDEVEQAGPGPASTVPIEFAAADAGFPAYEAMDTAIDNLVKGGELQAQAEALLTPVFAALDGLTSEKDIAKALLRAYPHMDASKLTATLTRLYFAAELAGRMSAAEDLGDDPAQFAAPVPPIHIHVDTRPAGDRLIVRQPDGSLLLKDAPLPASTTESNAK